MADNFLYYPRRLERIDNLLRKCRRCGKDRDLTDFHKNKPSTMGRVHICKFCCAKRTDPWIKSLNHARERCEYKKHPAYKCYGGSGVRCLLSRDEIQELWFRYKAYLMKRPSIDRIDSRGNYQVDNCRFIELAENSGRSRRTKVALIDGNGNRKVFGSLALANKYLKVKNVYSGGLVNCLKGRKKTYHGYKCEYV